MSLTADRNDPKLKEGQKNATGQHSVYLVLSEEERAKGFVRPVRDTYVHVGRDVKSHWKGIHRMLEENEKLPNSSEPDKKYVAIMTVITDEDGLYKGGTYVTQEEFDTWNKGLFIGGCGTETKMGLALAETYARDPNFYGATFCVHCNKHLPVSEFVWKGTNEKVGS